MSDKFKFSLPRTYDVGYAKPPETSRFKPGISGNPKGRPKGTQNKATGHSFERLTETILQEAYRKVPIVVGGKTKKITLIEANVRAMANSGAKGNTRAAVQLVKMVNTIEDRNASEHWQLMANSINYKDHWHAELARRTSLGLKGSQPLPHPDHVQIDRVTGDVWFTGPATKEQAEKHKKLQRMKDESHENIREYQKMLADPANKKIRKLIENEIAFESRSNEIIKKALHDIIYNYRGG